ncbi:MAG TPA: nuclease-related domain-containing protein, partial [Acidimicrobiales bacterium]|nr:nuclease-related domain-containing protein [Acidimicrobiales bacterium]
GEEITANVLNDLPDTYVVLHDVAMPGSRANLDHVVVGPTGVFTVETKHYGANVDIQRGVARSRGRSLDGVVRQAERQATAVTAIVGVEVTPLVVVHGAQVSVSPKRATPVVDGVMFCSTRRLVARITERPTVLAPDVVDRVADSVAARLRQR